MAIYNGNQIVPVPGNRVALVAARTPANWVEVQALATNGNAVWVGGPTVAAGSGIRLLQSEGFMFPYMGGPNPYTVNDIYIDAIVGGEGVSFIYGRL
jgi:hypothetical protein